LLKKNGEMALFAVSAEIPIIAAENHRFRGDVPDVNLMNRLQPIPFFIVAGFLLPMLLK
jgi:hypothetical protein